MRTVLKAKRAYTNEDVAGVFANITDYVTADETEQAVDLAVREVREVVGVANLGQAVYGWSGGKDSIALQVVMERAGINQAILGSIPHLEFHQYLTWIATTEQRPVKVHHYRNTELTPAWLALPTSAAYLFPKTARRGYFWTMAGTRRAQKMYQQEHRPAFQIYGRRWLDGNQIGTDGFSSSRNTGITSYSPLRTWSHEMVLAAIHYHQRELPPVYDWPHGWTAGTGSWPGRRVGTDEQAWAETWQIEPNRVCEAAAAAVPGAREWMERTGHA